MGGQNVSQEIHSHFYAGISSDSALKSLSISKKAPTFTNLKVRTALFMYLAFLSSNNQIDQLHISNLFILCKIQL